jgi:hypothetical protein
MTTPAFAVVGHPNKGKSSIVSTLAEDDGTAIGAEPGTTVNATGYTLYVDDQPQYVLYDTPGFQRAADVLRWLENETVPADQRPERVAAFVAAHLDDPRFHDECELLRPLLEGAGILYVVDGTKPYGAEYEIEMQVLRWTGRPRMALINLIGEGDYIDQWRDALGQYFSIVRVFDALHADFSRRLDLLRAFAELNEEWRDPLEAVVNALIQARRKRREQSAREISAMLLEALTATQRRRLKDDEVADKALETELTLQLQERIRRLEDQCRSVVERVYRHTHLERSEDSADIISMDLFAEEGWDLFGLSRSQIAMTGIVSGAIAGGGVDALLGGASLLLGAGIGALAGGAGAWFGSGELASVRVLGQPLGGRVLYCGPVNSANFPWVLLGRAWVHHHLVSERNHALREELLVEVSDSEHLMDKLDKDTRNTLGTIFRSARKQGQSSGLQARLTEAVDIVLEQAVVLDQTKNNVEATHL